MQGLQKPSTAVLVLCLSMLLIVFLPLVWEAVVLLQTLYAIWVVYSRLKVPSLPNLLPRSVVKKTDPNQRQAGSDRAGKPQGDLYLGVERRSQRQVWFRFGDYLRHALVTGTTGSGKTELLVSIAYNFLAAGGAGLMFADPKGDTKAAIKLSWIAKRFGREDDIFICNYLAPAQSRLERQAYQHSNTCNPTQVGGVKEVANMLISLLPKNTGGANAVFAENAVTLAQVMSHCLVELRDAGVVQLSWRVFRQHMSLPACIRLSQDQRLSEAARQEMDLFIFGIPGVSRSKNADQQPQSAHDQFAYIANYCQRGLATLTGSFGYIYDCEYGDFSYRDIVQRQRILLSVLPSLQNTQEEMSMLGKIDLFGKKQALSEGLATRLEGSGQSLKPTKTDPNCVPSLNIMDEYKYISVPGMSVAATQGRSLGWASIVGVQSYAGLSVDGEAEADEWLENTSTKFIGSTQGDSTFEKMNAIVGTEYVSRTENIVSKQSWLAPGSSDPAIRYERQSILDIRDLRAQTEGEFTVLVSDREIRMRAMFVDPDALTRKKPEVLMNSFVDLTPPTQEQLKQATFFARLIQKNFDKTFSEHSQVLLSYVDRLKTMRDADRRLW